MFVKGGILNNYERVKEEIDLHIRTNRTLHLLTLETGGFINMRGVYIRKNISWRVPDFKFVVKEILTKNIIYSGFI